MHAIHTIINTGRLHGVVKKRNFVSLFLVEERLRTNHARNAPYKNIDFSTVPYVPSQNHHDT